MRGTVNDSSYNPMIPGTVDADADDGLAHGLQVGLLIAIPLWILIGIALVSAFQKGPIGGAISAAFMLAVVCEALLARRTFKEFWSRLWRRWFPVFNRSAWRNAHRHIARTRRTPVANTSAISYLEQISGRRITSVQDLLGVIGAPPAARPAAVSRTGSTSERPSTLRQTAAFASLAIAYLHYYFWDINLQIASLHSLTVFVAVKPLHQFAT